MAMHKNIEYSMYCDMKECDMFEDYVSELKSPKRHFERLGYKKINGLRYCKKCLEKIKKIK